MSGSSAAKGGVLSRTGGALMLLVVGLGCGAAIAASPDIAAAVLVLQIPGVAVLLVDPTPGRAVGRTMMLFQGAASVRPILSIWYQCEGLNACVGMVTDRRTVLTVLLAAVGGFILTQALPLLLKLWDDGRMVRRKARLAADRQRLIEEWELDR